MKFLLPFLLLFLCSCTASPFAQQQIDSLQQRQASLQHVADTTEDPTVRAEALQAIADLREQEATVRAEDYGQQASLWGQIIGSVVGIGTVTGGMAGAIARKYGKSRASGDIAKFQARLEAFERGLATPAPWGVYPDATTNIPAHNIPQASPLGGTQTGTTDPASSETT